METIRTVELFAGVGGFRLGLQAASNRFDVIWAKLNGVSSMRLTMDMRSVVVGHLFRITGWTNITCSSRSNDRGRLRVSTPIECERLNGFPDGWTDIRYA